MWRGATEHDQLVESQRAAYVDGPGCPSRRPARTALRGRPAGRVARPTRWPARLPVQSALRRRVRFKGSMDFWSPIGVSLVLWESVTEGSPIRDQNSLVTLMPLLSLPFRFDLIQVCTTPPADEPETATPVDDAEALAKRFPSSGSGHRTPSAQVIRKQPLGRKLHIYASCTFGAAQLLVHPKP